MVPVSALVDLLEIGTACLHHVACRGWWGWKVGVAAVGGELQGTSRIRLVSDPDKELYMHYRYGTTRQL